MEEKDIYKIVEELEKNKASNNTKIDSLYGLLDEVKKENKVEVVKKPNLQFEEMEVPKEEEPKPKTTSLRDFKDKVKPIRRPAIPTKILEFDKRSECFINILQAVDYGDNNADYVDGHKAALEKYYMIASSNPKDFYVVEGRVNDEIKAYKVGSSADNYSKGYRDGLNFVAKALENSKLLLSRKINEILLKELS